MKIKTNEDTSSVTIGELREGTVFTYHNATYIRGAGDVSKVNKVHCTRLKDGNRHEMDSARHVTHHPYATLTLDP